MKPRQATAVGLDAFELVRHVGLVIHREPLGVHFSLSRHLGDAGLGVAHVRHGKQIFPQETRDARAARVVELACRAVLDERPVRAQEGVSQRILERLGLLVANVGLP